MKRAALALALCVAACSLPPPILAPDAPVEAHAVHAARPWLGVTAHLWQIGPELRAFHDAGADFVRTDMFWRDVEKNGRFDFTAHDAALTRLEAMGLRALFILDYTHPAHGTGRIDTPSEITAYAHFAHVAAAHFRGRQVAWEIWNEPDVARGDQYIAPADFARLVRESAHAIHEADPDARVISGGLSWVNLDYARAMLAEWQANGAPEIAGFAAHPYRKGPPESASLDFASLSALLRAHSAPWPVWNSEWGYSAAANHDGHSAASRTRQAVLLTRALLTAWDGGADAVAWYEMRDGSIDAHDSEMNFGLVDTTGADKPALHAFATFARQTHGMRLVGALRDPPRGVEALKFEDDSRVLIVLWSRQAGQVVTAPIRRMGFAGAENVAGASVNVTREVTLREADGPVYLSWRK